jgi:hypothetical protein
MTKEMTPSIGEKRIKSKLDIFLHTTLGARSARSAHRGPKLTKAQRGIIIKTSKKTSFMRIANCIERFSFHEQNQIFGVFLLNKRQYSMEQERAP